MMYRDVLKWLLGLLIIGLVAGMIINQSLKDGDETKGMSSGISAFVYETVESYKGYPERDLNEIDLIVRKLAHFIEYLFYGTITLLVFAKLIKNRFVLMFVTILLTLPVPFVDEFLIQTQVSGRSPHVIDVMIDLLGLLLAYIIGFLYVLVLRSKEDYLLSR